MFRHVVIGHLERGDAWDALRITLVGSRRTFDLALVGELVERTAGHPHFLQFFGGFLCSRVGRADVALADHHALESSLLHELDLAFFEDGHLVAGGAGQRVLDAMARVASRHDGKPAPRSGQGPSVTRRRETADTPRARSGARVPRVCAFDVAGIPAGWVVLSLERSLPAG